MLYSSPPTSHGERRTANGAQVHLATINTALQKRKASQYWRSGLARLGNEKFVDLFEVDLGLLQEQEKR